MNTFEKTFTWQEPDIDLLAQAQYTLNNKPIEVEYESLPIMLRARTALLTNWSIRFLDDGYWQVAVTITYNPDGWDRIIATLRSGITELKTIALYADGDFTKLPGQSTPWRNCND